MTAVYCDAAFPADAAEALRTGLGGRPLVAPGGSTASNLVAAAADPGIDACDVAFGQPPVEAVLGAARLRWVHLTSAGWTRFDTPAVLAALRERDIALTTSSTVYADPCAEHTLAMMLAAARCLPDALDARRERAWPAADLRRRSFLLRGQTVLLLGFGAIGRRLAELLAPFGVRLLVYRRRFVGDEPGEPVTDLDAALGAADHVVDLLPETPETRGFLDARRLARIRTGAWLYNVGRGATIDEDALVRELTFGRLGGAWLDVARREPPPPDSPLWTVPRCWLTPHSAGGRGEEFVALVEHFLANLERFERGAVLVDRVA